MRSVMNHIKCRNCEYPKSGIQRLKVLDDKVSWNVPWPDYKPVNYTSKIVLNKNWADPDLSDVNFNPKWNQRNKVDRSSFEGEYEIKDGFPLNPKGRTGLSGRGLLGRWGPNHAADPIVTRWKKETNNGEKILQFIAIKRGDNNEIAIPGGMVDPGEVVSQTLKREFSEEALNGKNDEKIHALFSSGVDIYKGYVDDPRNTDNAWMETVAQNFHDEDGSLVGGLDLEAGDDAVGVCWLDISKDLKLYASHLDFIKIVALKHNANF